MLDYVLDYAPTASGPYHSFHGSRVCSVAAAAYLQIHR